MGRPYRRRGHTRVSRSGRVAYVADHYVRDTGEPLRSEPRAIEHLSKCRRCGAFIQIVRSSFGGLIYYEPGLARFGTLHSCFTVGRGISTRRAVDHPDLFDWADNAAKNQVG